MNMNLGTRIADLRRAKGMTQEQLAGAVGVSAPAVSKWETNSSCPDISLLCPIARALDTNVDTLLQFEEELSREKLNEIVNDIVETTRTGKLEEAEVMLQKHLHNFPSSSALKYNAAGVMDFFTMAFSAEAPEKKDAWKTQKKQLLEEVRSSGNSQYWQAAVSRLAAIAIQEGELEKAEQLLKELPEDNTEATLFRAQLHLKENEPEKALEVSQRRLYELARQLLLCLASMMNGGMITDNEKTLEICEVYCQLERILGIGDGGSECFFMEAYRRMDRPEDALKSLIKMAEIFTEPPQGPNPLLFSPAIKPAPKQSAASPEMKQLLLRCILEDEFFAPYLEREEVKAALEKLRKE